MSADQNEIAKAIREQTAYFKSITDPIKLILLVAGITIIAVYGFIFVCGLVSNYLNNGHEMQSMPVANPISNNVPNMEYPKLFEKEMMEYQKWCTTSQNIWVMPKDGNLAYCKNIFGMNVNPDKLVVNETSYYMTLTNGSKMELTPLVNCDVDPKGCKDIWGSLK